jgi:urea transport system substrate-binding protein
MGLVYQAEDTRLGRQIALKVMHPNLTVQTHARERFLREARAMAALRNDHVVTIYEVSEAADSPYLAMEFLLGETLDARLQRDGRLPVSEIVRIGGEIAIGLAAAHEHGLVHRDIKPANIWLEAESGRVKILDFGLARQVDNRLGVTREGDILGTPHYMAPEQALGEAIDGRCDLFSLGVVLYRLCTGELPFEGVSLTAVLMAIAMDAPRPVRECNGAIPESLADLVMGLLEKDATRRPASASEVVAALSTIRGDETLVSLADSMKLERSQAQGLKPLGMAGSSFSRHAPRRPRATAIVVAVIATTVIGIWGAAKYRAGSPDTGSESVVVAPSGLPIRIGILHSRTGTMAISERPMADGVLLAVEEINEHGGVLGRPLEAVIEDGESEETIFARKAAKLIDQDKVAVIVGCWTSASRKAVKAVVEARDHLLLYPVSYEGMEQSPCIVYGGSVPNQHLVPALRWCYGFLNKKRWYLVGSDSIFPHAANAIIRDEASVLGSQIVGENYLPPGATEVTEVVRQIAAVRPDLIINTINGDTNVGFVRALRRAGIRAGKCPTLSLTLSEEELSGLNADEIAGNYAAGNYFQSLDLPENQAFLNRVRNRFGPERIVSDQMQTAYALVRLWAQSVQAVGNTEVRAVREAIKGQSLDSPEGLVTIDPATLHTTQVGRVGRIDDRGRFQEVFLSPQPIRPQPFPESRKPGAWKDFLEQLHGSWGGRWENPANRY